MVKKRCCDPFTIGTNGHSSKKRRISDGIFKKLTENLINVNARANICDTCRKLVGNFENNVTQTSQTSANEKHSQKCDNESSEGDSEESEDSDVSMNEIANVGSNFWSNILEVTYFLCRTMKSC